MSKATFVLTQRDVLAGVAAASVLLQTLRAANRNSAIGPFPIDVTQSEIIDLPRQPATASGLNHETAMHPPPQHAAHHIAKSHAVAARAVKRPTQQEHVMNHPEKVIYTAKVHTIGGQTGTARSDDGRLAVKLYTPDTAGIGTNTQQLFAAGWSDCYMSAIGVVAHATKVHLPPDVEVDAEVDFGANGEGFGIAVRPNVTLPGNAPDIARHVLAAPHLACPYSRSAHGNIAVETTLV